MIKIKQLLRGTLVKIAKMSYVSKWKILALDLILMLLASLFAINSLSFFKKTANIPVDFIISYLFASIIISAILMFILKTYRGIIRHANLDELIKIFTFVSLKTICLLIFVAVYNKGLSPGSLFILFHDFLISLIFLAAPRAIFLALYTRLISLSTNPKKIFIYGANSKNSLLAKDNLDANRYITAGFLTRDKTLNNLRIGRSRVINIKENEDILNLVKKHDVSAILFPDDESVKQEKDSLVDFCISNKIEVLLVQPPRTMKNAEDTLPTIKEIEIEDLLGRAEIDVNLSQIKDIISNKTILVTGAAGSIGSEIVRQLAQLDIKEIIIVDNAESPLHSIRMELEANFTHLNLTPIIADVRNKTRLKVIFAKFKPQIVFHAAAYKHVPLMEENPCEAISVNVFGTKNIADISVEYNVEKFVMVSTDKAVNPTNVMGASKRIAEIYTQSFFSHINETNKNSQTQFITTRFGNVLGSNGSVIPFFKKQIAQGGPITVTHPDIIRYFMTIPEACRLVLEAASIGKGGEIFIFDMGQPVKILDLAQRMIYLAGLEPNKDIMIEYTGLRPGEKLYEELLAEDETTQATSIEKVRIAKVKEYDYTRICTEIDKLIELIYNNDNMLIVKQMKNIVPEFKSKNSKYEELDN